MLMLPVTVKPESPGMAAEKTACVSIGRLRPVGFGATNLAALTLGLADG